MNEKPLTQAEQEQVYGGPLPEWLTIRRFSPEEIDAMDNTPMIEKRAEPKLVDTGTIFVETAVCRHCGQPIERELRPKKVGGWIHSYGKSAYCYGPR